jgi:DNA-binding LacI/PurR family transcriptional regulator
MPKHQRVAERIRAMIDERKWRPGDRLPPDSQFFKRFRVSRQTLLKALDHLAREGLIVRRRGSGTYVADPHRGPLLPGRALKIGVLWHTVVSPASLSDGLAGAIFRGLLHAWGMDRTEPEFPSPAKRRATRIVWSQPERGLTLECLGEHPDSMTQHPPFQDVRAGKFNGLFVADIFDEDYLEKVLDLGIPTVLVDFSGDRFAARADQVFIDARWGYRAAVRHFMEQGLRRIHFLGALRWAPAPTEAMSHKEWQGYRQGKLIVWPESHFRLSAYRQAMEEHGTTPGDDYIHFALQAPNYWQPILDKLLSLPKGKRPEALICHGTGEAEWFITAFAERGLKLQAAGATAGRHIGRAVPIRADIKELGLVSADLLLSRLVRPDRPFLSVGIRLQLDGSTATRQP